MKSNNLVNLLGIALRLSCSSVAIGDLVFVIINVFVYHLRNPTETLNASNIQTILFVLVGILVFSLIPVLAATLFLAALLRRESWYGFTFRPRPFLSGFIVGLTTGLALCIVELVVTGIQGDSSILIMYVVEVLTLASLGGGFVAVGLDSELPKQLPPAS